jgi:transcriptional regulator with XRE-family HTH domain
VSDASGLSVSQLSKLENGKARITIDTAIQISAILKVPATQLLGAPEKRPQGRRSVTRAGHGVRHPVDGMEFEVLGNDFKDKRNLNWRVTVTARSLEESGGWRKHGGEEFLHVISGELALLTQLYDPLILRVGDSVVFDADTEHTYVSCLDEPAVLIMTNSVPF